MHNHVDLLEQNLHSKYYYDRHMPFESFMSLIVSTNFHTTIKDYVQAELLEERLGNQYQKTRFYER